MSQEPEKKETKNPADRFNKVNRKMTIVWTGVAVLVVLAIALGIFFASKGCSSKQPEGSGSAEGTVVINDDGQKVLVDDEGNEVEVLDENPIDTIRQTGNSNLSGIQTDTGSGVAGTGEETVKTPWTTLNDADYGIEIRTLAAGYDGAYLEDGSDDEDAKTDEGKDTDDMADGHIMRERFTFNRKTVMRAAANERGDRE